jgi:cell division septation protein DedD
MSPKNQDDRSQESKTNSQLKSSIVHKPFATGTINIFNPYRTKKGSKSDGQLAASKLYLDAQLEKSEQLAPLSEASLGLNADELAEFEYHESNWSDWLFSPWSISAIAVIFLANLISGAVIWRNHRDQASIESAKAVPTLGSANIANEEFMPLNLSTLSRLKTAEDLGDSSVIEPIAPALAPINLAQSTSEPQYYYVLTEYTGDASLATARQKVKQVSLVNFPQGVFIYLGAYQEKDQAEEFIAHLEQENFAAHIYPAD